ncbi:hypothetical protein CIHG_03563 [Coccidioides immitis H538.4]|uniref:Uncharacterized protein n=1 Tax=Coccidioides immitis H538.4 TaxID=396776 RepID=A0A0J8RMG5_COCIT|nr:hypothetical protein CIHG_03563 [Coccidioides immitis H538.4]
MKHRTPDPAYAKTITDPSTEAGEFIAQFLRIAKTVRKPIVRLGAGGFATPDNPDITRFWRAKNNWLYDLIDSTITTQARVYFKQPGGLVAYKLWKSVEIALLEKPQIHQGRLAKEIQNMTRQSASGERNCIERFLAIRMELERMGLKYHDHALHDILKENITPQWREFIQNTYNMAYNKGADLQGHNLEGLLKG